MNRHSTVYPGSKGRHRPRRSSPEIVFEDSSMFDVLMVALALGFFAVSVGYAYACDRL
jgi:hypothetical protein